MARTWHQARAVGPSTLHSGEAGAWRGGACYALIMDISDEVRTEAVLRIARRLRSICGLDASECIELAESIFDDSISLVREDARKSSLRELHNRKDVWPYGKGINTQINDGRIWMCDAHSEWSISEGDWSISGP